MKLTDQEQVVLKAIYHVNRNGIAPIPDVLKAVGYPKATTKKILIGLERKDAVTLHRHDYAGSLTPAERKLLIRQQDGKGNWHYFGAVSVRKQNPGTILTERIPVSDVRSTLLALSRSPFDGLVGMYGDEVRGAYAYGKVLYLLFYAGDLKPEGGEYRISDAVVSRAGELVDRFYEDQRKTISGNQFLTIWRKTKRGAKQNPGGKHLPGLPAKAQREYEDILKSAKASGRYKGREKEVAARTVKKQYGTKRRKNKTFIKAKRVVIKEANPHRRIKVRNKYIDLVIKGQAKKAPEGWKVGKKTFAQGRGTVSVSSGYYLDRHTGMVYAKRERNIAGYRDESGQFHPIRSGQEARYSTAGGKKTFKGYKKSRKKYKPAKVGEKHTYSPKKSAKRRAQSKRLKSAVTSRKSTTKRLAGRSLQKSSGLLKKGKRRNPPMTLALVNRTSPKARANRKQFSGEYRKDTPLYFPEGTPGGLSKLGKLLQIQTENVVVEPHTPTWLCRDTAGKLHLGTTSKDAVIWNGPKQDFGKVMQVDYEDVKKHLGYKHPQGFYHFMGEEDGDRPTLYADGKGGLKFKGGNYRFTSRGIEN